MFKKLLEWLIYVPFSRSINLLFIKKIIGWKNIHKGGCIIASNHTSYLDIPVLSAAVILKKNRKIRYITKKDLFKNPMMRYICETTKSIPLDRYKKGGDKNALSEAIKALKSGDVIGIFPEGTRSPTGKIQKGKTGVARLALWSKCPVIPVGIKGTYELMPKGKLFPKFKKNIVINIGKPLYFNKYNNKAITKKMLRRITHKVMNQIKKIAL